MCVDLFGGRSGALPVRVSQMKRLLSIFSKKDEYEAALRKAEQKLAKYEAQIVKELKALEALPAQRAAELNKVRRLAGLPQSTAPCTIST